MIAAGGLTLATRDRASWRPWRRVAWIPFAAALIGLVAGFDRGWAKVVYVLGITLPVAVVGTLVRATRPGTQSASRPVLPSAARSG